MPTGPGATGSGPGAWGQGTRDKVSGRPPKGGSVTAPRFMIQRLLRKWRCRICKRKYFHANIGAKKGFRPHTWEKIWNSFGFGSIGTKSIGNYKVSGRPSKGGAGDRAQVYDTTPTQEVAMPDLQT